MLSTAASTRLATLLTGVALAGGLAPSASASPNRTPSAPEFQQRLYVNPDTGFAYPAQGSDATADGGSPQPTVHAPSSGGFDWPSAAIGGAAGGLLLLLTTLTIGVARRRRAPLDHRNALRG